MEDRLLHNYQSKKHQVRAAGKTRTVHKFTQYSPAEKIPKTEVEQTDVKGDSSGEAELKQTVDNLNDLIKHDHIYACDCVDYCVCPGRVKVPLKRNFCILFYSPNL